MWLSRRPASPKGASAGRVTLPGGAGFGGGGGAELRKPLSTAPMATALRRRRAAGAPLDTAEGQVLCGVRTPPAGGFCRGRWKSRCRQGPESKLCQDGTIWLNGAHITKGGQFVPGSGSGD